MCATSSAPRAEFQRELDELADLVEFGAVTTALTVKRQAGAVTIAATARFFVQAPVVLAEAVVGRRRPRPGRQLHMIETRLDQAGPALSPSPTPEVMRLV